VKSLTSGQWNIATFVRHCGKCETTNVPGWNVARREFWELKSDEYKAAHPFVELSWVLPQQAPPTPPAEKKAKAFQKAKEDRPKSSLFAFTWKEDPNLNQHVPAQPSNASGGTMAVLPNSAGAGTVNTDSSVVSADSALNSGELTPALCDGEPAPA